MSISILDDVPQVSGALFIFLHSFFFLFLRLNYLNLPVFKFADFFLLPGKVCY